MKSDSRPDDVDPVRGLHDLADDLNAFMSDAERLRQGPWVEYPSSINLETIAACPARCTFCTYPRLERRGSRMSDALLDKILTDLEGIPRTVPFVLFPFLINEPFADRRLDDLLERTERRLPNAVIDLVTTGTLLDGGRLRRLQQRRNIREVCISLNFIDAAEYEAEIGLPWNRTWRNTLALHDAVVAEKTSFRVVVSRVATDDDRDDDFIRFARERLPAFDVRLNSRHDWLGKVPAPKRDFDHLPCMQWFELKIVATGKVALCCQDSLVEYPLGDAATTPLLEIYNQPYAVARRKHLTARRMFDVCRGCGFRSYFSRPDEHEAVEGRKS